MSKKLNHPSILSVVRSMSASATPFYGTTSTDAPLFSIGAKALVPVIVVREGLRGTQAAAATPLEKRGLPNPQRVDFTTLPIGQDALLIEGNLLVNGKCNVLETSNDEAFTKAHAEFMECFAAAGGMRVLAERFVMNMLNGSVLFRNRLGMNVRCAARIAGDNDSVVEVRESQLAKGLRLSISDILCDQTRARAEALAQRIENALAGRTETIRVDLRAYVEMGEGQEVFPSQEMASNKEDGEGRILARAPSNGEVDNHAVFHGRKVLNAIKTVDTWYAANPIKALPLEPYGVDQSAQNALRSTKIDFYTLMLKMPALVDDLKAGNLSGDALFVGGVFIRGGVFSKKSEKSEKTEKAEEAAEE